MIKFLLKGVLRDRSRSLLPVIIVAIGVMLTVSMGGYIQGVTGDIIDQSARFQTGHIKVVTGPYRENMDQFPIDLALLEADSMRVALTRDYPEVNWVLRTNFGGLVDVPDERGETRAQGPALGIGLEMFRKESGEAQRMNIETSLVQGRLPTRRGEALIGHVFSQRLDANVGDRVTYIGTTSHGGMSFYDFTVVGTVRFGLSALDRGSIIVDMSDVQQMLDLPDGSGEILGFLQDGIYREEEADRIADLVNRNADRSDEFAPVALTLEQQNNLGGYLEMANTYSAIFIGLFVMAMSLVLWNTGLLGGLRRYQEFGIRLALGEHKSRIYGTLVVEAVIIGVMGSMLGTALGLGVTLYMQRVGIDVSQYLSDTAMMMPSVLHSKFTFNLLYIGFIPGLLAVVVGNMLSGLGVYKRSTSSLFKELEV